MIKFLHFLGMKVKANQNTKTMQRCQIFCDIVNYFMNFE